MYQGEAQEGETGDAAGRRIFPAALFSVQQTFLWGKIRVGDKFEAFSLASRRRGAVHVINVTLLTIRLVFGRCIRCTRFPAIASRNYVVAGIRATPSMCVDTPHGAG